MIRAPMLVALIVGTGSAIGVAHDAESASIRQLYAFACNSSGCPNGNMPVALLRSADGNFYGATQQGGSGDRPAGTVFRLTPDFKLNTLHTFLPDSAGKYPNGSWPTALVEGNDGQLYGTTISGGANDQGAVFAVSKTGRFRLLHSLCVSCGEGTDAEFLVRGGDGNFYGGSYGVLFRATPKGAFKALHTFDTDTEGPTAQGMTLASDGNLYGTAAGGQSLITTAFRLTPAGKFDILQTFHYSQFPTSPPIQASNGKLYGVLTLDAARDASGIFQSDISGRHFIERPLGTARGDLPHYLMQASDGSLWAAAYTGTHYANGAIFQYSKAGDVLGTLVLDGSSGAHPDTALIELGNGTLIGAAADSGTAGKGQTSAGTIFAVER